MPATKNVGTNIKNLKNSNKRRSKSQIIAIALEEARKKGAKIPLPGAKNDVDYTSMARSMKRPK